MGAYYEQVSGTTLPVGGFDTSQAPVREGDTEYIRLRGGERKAVRRWDPATQDYTFTALGKTYYSRLKRNYVVQVPVKVTGVRKNGTQYQIRSSLPVAKLGIDRVTLPLNLTAAQRTQRVKEMVRAQLDLTQPLYEVSKETWSFDETSDGALTIHEETVGIDPDSGEAVVALDRRVGTAPLSVSDLPFADQLCPQAFEDRDDHACVPRQIAALLDLDIGQVAHEMTDLEQRLYGQVTWEDKGCTPRMVLEFARGRGIGAAIIHNGRQLEQVAGPNPLVASLHEDHLFFYSGRARRKLMSWSAHPGSSATKLRREHAPAATTPPAEEWLPWDWSLEPGHYYTDEETMSSARSWMLKNGRNPRVILKDVGAVRSLCYVRTHRDGAKGNVVIHCAPPEFDAIQAWMAQLALGMKYTGQGLPAISAQVLLALVKKGKQREYLSGEQKAEILEVNNHRCALCGGRSQVW